MLNLLEKHTGCTCVPSNTTKHIPSYPYNSFSIININTKKGTYSVLAEKRDGKDVETHYKPALLKYSFTVHSDSDAEALEKAMLIRDFFDEEKRLELEDNGIIVAELGAITPRDNLLTIEYEYRKGLDVTLRFNNVIEKTTTETIDHVSISNEMLGDITI